MSSRQGSLKPLELDYLFRSRGHSKEVEEEEEGGETREDKKAEKQKVDEIGETR